MSKRHFQADLSGALPALAIFATCSLIADTLLPLAVSPRGEAMSWAVSRVPGGGVLGRSPSLMAVAASAARAVSSCSSNLSISELATVVSWDQSTSPLPAGMAHSAVHVTLCNGSEAHTSCTYPVGMTHLSLKVLDTFMLVHRS